MYLTCSLLWTFILFQSLNCVSNAVMKTYEFVVFHVVQEDLWDKFPEAGFLN
jgi:hypothetical protein